MSVEFPHVEAERAHEGSLALNQALMGVRLARAQLEEALVAVAMPEPAADAWRGAVRARISDLAQIEEIFEHARNVLAKVGRDLPQLLAAHRSAAAADADAIAIEAIGLLTQSAEQFLKLSGPIAFAPVPESAQSARATDGTVVPLDAAHALPEGLVLVKGRDF